MPPACAPTGTETTGSSVFHDTATVFTGQPAIHSDRHGHLHLLPQRRLHDGDRGLDPDGDHRHYSAPVPAVGDPRGPLAAGSYSFHAVFTSGDTNYTGSTSACEPFSVGQGAATTSTQVIVNATGLPPTGTETTGSAFHDQAIVSTGQPAIPPTGTVTYTLFTGDCTGTVKSTQTVTIVPAGLPPVPPSATTGPLRAGSYAFQAVYNGDANYAGSTSACEPFSVGKGAATTSTQVISNATGLPPTGTETTGSTFHDSATVFTGQPAIPPTGTVTYTFFSGDCTTGTVVSTQTVTIVTTLPPVPPSATTGPLRAGSYAFQAVYNGDANYAGSTSACEPFSVGKGAATTSTQVISNATGLPTVTGTETTGSSTFHDSATVFTGQPAHPTLRPARSPTPSSPAAIARRGPWSRPRR